MKVPATLTRFKISYDRTIDITTARAAPVSLVINAVGWLVLSTSVGDGLGRGVGTLVVGTPVGKIVGFTVAIVGKPVGASVGDEVVGFEVGA